ncbi:hypothetical protein BCF55_0227 [Hydrogenivirga caldilitoris]|uniref:HPt domain-containing protein n=1 Tax=Hydrogenivirga caldilitoris TaxID=246264 RepID=A0A497XM57_9AQUI|nr:hypothetical protein [Hydrogenivirga caldilitoris]RLJ69967.1 hypothetical protein BCF55_0227 [Hydrogenivirga caldilitoris]
MMSKEFEMGIGLLNRFKETLVAISNANTPEEAKPLIEQIKHPIFGAMAQIKAGQGPLREEILAPMAVVVSQFRELTDLNALKKAIPEVLNLVQQAEKLAQEGAEQKG